MIISAHKTFNLLFHSDHEKSEILTFINERSIEGEYITCWTSGSTGTPQEIKIKKQALIVSAKNTNNFFQLEAKDKIALCMSVDYIAGKMMIVRALIAGLTLAVYPVSAKLV